MPLGIDPETLLLVGIVGGIGAAGTYSAYMYAERAGPKLTIKDLRPAAPWEGLPLPIFLYKNPELLSELSRK
jgi:hypothetical protein